MTDTITTTTTTTPAGEELDETGLRHSPISDVPDAEVAFGEGDLDTLRTEATLDLDAILSLIEPGRQIDAVRTLVTACDEGRMHGRTYYMPYDQCGCVIGHLWAAGVASDGGVVGKSPRYKLPEDMEREARAAAKLAGYGLMPIECIIYGARPGDTPATSARVRIVRAVAVAKLLTLDPDALFCVGCNRLCEGADARDLCPSCAAKSSEAEADVEADDDSSL